MLQMNKNNKPNIIRVSIFTIVQSLQPSEVRRNLSFFLQIRKLRLRKVKLLGQGYMARSVTPSITT